jgi:hypothetical protein
MLRPQDGDGDGIAECDIGAFEVGEDADADGIGDDEDVCPDTTLPESVPTHHLGVNRWALVDDDDIFDTTPPPGGGNGPGYEFALQDTAGCSCEQIIDELGLGQGHVKFGCSTGVMLEWIGSVDDDDRRDNTTIFEQDWRDPDRGLGRRRALSD